MNMLNFMMKMKIGDINYNNISNAELVFSDYDPADKTKLTFRGKIKLSDLFDILLSDQYINNILSTEKVKTKHL